VTTESTAGTAATADEAASGADVARAEELSGALAADGVHGVALCYVDTAGVTRVKGVPVTRLSSAARRGVGMSPVFDTFLADDSIVRTDVLGGPDGDLRLFPDLSGLVALAGQPGWAWAPVDRRQQDGEPHPACSRTFLRRMVARADEAGIVVRAAIEIEWVLGRDDVPAGELVPATSGPAYGMTRIVEQSEFTADLLAALATQGVDVDQLHPEYSPGQFELSVGALDPVAAADRSVLVRQTIRAVARRHGLRVSFSPSVVPGSVGNGGHVHLSAWRDGASLHAGGDGPYGLTKDGEAFVAGLLRELLPLSGLATPSPASLLRLQPSHWAGVFTCWGRETREAAVRLVTGLAGDEPRAANVEVKCADLAANPYLLIGGLVAAGLAGVADGLGLPPETTGDPVELSDEERERRGIARLPTDLGDVVDHFAGSELLREALGPVLADAVVAVRRGEWARMSEAEPEDVAAAYRWVY
jgi:glutamine synthetase